MKDVEVGKGEWEREGRKGRTGRKGRRGRNEEREVWEE